MRNTARVLLAAATASALSPAAAVQAGAIRHDRNDADYVALGNDPKYAAVGSITWLFGLARGSGTLISPRWVLTAGHVVDSADARTFRAGGTASNNGTAFTGGAHFAHESWVSPEAFDGFDIGLLPLPSPVTSIAPASRFTASDEVGRIGTSVGFGVFATGTTPANPFEFVGQKRAGTNMIDVLGAAAYPAEGASNNLIAADFDDPANADGDNAFGAIDPLNLEYCVTSGDSGGGIFVDVGARPFIAAVHSFLDDPESDPDPDPPGQPDPNDDSGYHDTFGSMRVSVFNEWIDDKISRNWNNAVGGAFATAGNWTGGLPDQYDVAGFNTAGTYIVTLVAPTISHRLISRNGHVTLNLGGSTYTLTSLSYEGSLIVGRYGSNASSLTITNGIFTTRETVLAEQPLSSGTLTLGAGATWNVVGDVYAGGNFIAPGGSGTLVLNPGSSTTITGKLKLHPAGSLHLAGGGFSAALLDLAGGTIATSSPATLSMPIATSTGATVTKSGTASLTINGTQTHAAGTTLHVAAGMLHLDSNAGSASTAHLAIVADAPVHFGSTQNLRALDIAAGVTATLDPGGGGKVLKIDSLDLAASARLDLTDNKLTTADPLGTWNGSSYTGVSGLVDSGRGNAANAQWDGAGIVTSDTRAVSNNDLVSIGAAKAGAIRGILDTATTTFAGQTVFGSDAIAMVTWGGDANLDGKINIDDYGQIDFNVSSSGSVFGWYNGDFNYDGKINIDDYGIIDFNVTAQNLVFPTGDTAEGATAVPEPLGLGLIVVVPLSCLRRRARRHPPAARDAKIY